jgi:hypothetical protein
MNIKYFAFILGVLAIIVAGVWFSFPKTVTSPIIEPPVIPTISSFEECEKAGHPIVNGVRRQCTTPDGRTFAEETEEQITYTNATSDQIKIDTPFPGAVTGKSFSVRGSARGMWFFEASFPIEVIDAQGVRIAISIAQAQGEWMTENFVPYIAEITVPASFIGDATLVLHKDNPSGLAEHDASISFPITIEY